MYNTVTDKPINNTYNALIIGAGSIGALKSDKFDSPCTKEVLTIAHAFTNHPNIKLVGIVDTTFERADKAAQKWNTNRFVDIDTAFKYYEDNGVQIDLIAVCVPTEFHKEVMIKIIKFKPKLVMCEKPFCNSEEAICILTLYKEKGIQIQIDYIRRFSSPYQIMKTDIENKAIQKIYHTTLKFTRGNQHEACHFIDLCNFWFGEFEDGFILNHRHKIVDRDENDPTYATYLSFEKCKHVFMCPVDGRDFGVFEIDVMTDIGRFVFSQNGTYLDYYPVIPEPVYGDYNSLSNKFQRADTELTTALMAMAHNCVQYLNGTHNLISPGTDAIKVHEIYEVLKGSA